MSTAKRRWCAARNSGGLTDCTGHPERKLLKCHASRLKIAFLPASCFLQARPRVLLLLLHEEPPAVVVVDVHYVGGIGEGERLVSAKDQQVFVVCVGGLE